MKMKFEPKEDITAYELALIYSNIVMSQYLGLTFLKIDISKDQWDSMLDFKGQNIQRHFRIVEAGGWNNDERFI